MKKLFALLLTLTMMLSLAACGDKTESASSGGTADSGTSGSGGTTGSATSGGENTTTSATSQPGQADEQTENILINAPDEAWFSSTTNIAYVFLADGVCETYSLKDGTWRSYGDGTYKLNGDSLTIDSATHPVSVTDNTLTFTIKDKEYVYERTSPFDPGTSNSDGEYHGNADGAADLSNVTDENYKEVAKAVFGIDLKDVAGLELTKAESPNGVNNLNITYSGSNQDAKATLQYYFEACKEVSSDGVYSIEVNPERYSVSKGTKYEEFEAFYETEASKGTLSQSKWIYDHNGTNVQLVISIDAQETYLGFTLLG